MYFIARLRAKAKNQGAHLVRKSFPTPVLDRSPIFGVSNEIVLRTCFRLGEALNIGSQAVRSRKNVVIELYARVVADPDAGLLIVSITIDSLPVQRLVEKVMSKAESNTQQESCHYGRGS